MPRKKWQKTEGRKSLMGPYPRGRKLDIPLVGGVQRICRNILKSLCTKRGEH